LESGGGGTWRSRGWKGTLPYFRFSLFTDNAVSGGSYQSNGISIVMYQEMINTGDELYYTYTVSGSPYVRISFEYTGKAGLLIWNSTTSSWAVISERPDTDCELYASCGPFGYCDHTEAVPSCRCLDGFELLDSLNFSRGCRRKEALKCGNKDYFITMPNMKVPDKFLHIRNRSFDQCAAECTLNCSCVAYFPTDRQSRGRQDTTLRSEPSSASLAADRLPIGSPEADRLLLCDPSQAARLFSSPPRPPSFA